MGPQHAGGIRLLGAGTFAVVAVQLALGASGAPLDWLEVGVAGAGAPHAAQVAVPAVVPGSAAQSLWAPRPVVAGRGMRPFGAAPVTGSRRDLWLSEIPVKVLHSRVGMGGQVSMTGVLPSGRSGTRLALQFRTARMRWQSVAWARSGARGAFRVSGPVTRSGLVRVVVDGTDGDRRAGLGSSPQRVGVQPLIPTWGVPGNVLWGRPAVVVGRLVGGGRGRRVVLEQRRRLVWSAVAGTRTAAGGRFRLTYMARSGAPLRVRYPGSRDLAGSERLVRWRGRGAVGPIGGGLGLVRIARNANRGRPLSPEMARFAARMAGAYGRRLVITVGTNHSPYTVGGSVSDHWSGNAADFGMAANHGTVDGPVGDRIAAAALVAAGLSPAEALAKARAGGAITVVRGGRRVQAIWKSYIGGNHHYHVHVGIGRAQ